MTTQRIDISNRTIIFSVFFLLALWLLYQIRSIIILIFISFILMTAVNPLIKLGKKIRIPSLLIMLVVYIGIITLLTTVVASLVPAVIEQTRGLTQMIPIYLHNLEGVFNTQFDPSVAGSYFSSIPSNILKLAAGLFDNIINILAVFFLAYYLTLERPHLHKYLLRFFPREKAEERAEAARRQTSGRAQVGFPCPTSARRGPPARRRPPPPPARPWKGR